MINSLATKYTGQLDIVHIYIREAHPKDEWKITGDVVSCSIKQPRTLSERLAVAQRFVTDYQPLGTTVVDGMDNDLEHKYKAWPERLYVLDGDWIVYSGDPGPFGYIPEEVDRFLQKYLNTPMPTIVPKCQ
jgi:hypothetical protein